MKKPPTHTTLSEHQKWCNDQHEKTAGCLTKIDKRLAILEGHMKTQAAVGEEVVKELKQLNAWALKRDGATRALMWVGGIAGTGVAFTALMWSIISGQK